MKSRDHLLNIYAAPKEHMSVKHHQEADFGIEKLPRLARHPHRIHKSPHEIIAETDETKTSAELDPEEESSEVQQEHIFSDFHKERKLSLMEDQFLIKEEDEQNENEDDEENDVEEEGEEEEEKTENSNEEN